MGNSKYLDGLSAEEKRNLALKLWNIQSHKCFICGEEIDIDIQTPNIDHIKPLANGGKDDETNFALTHEHCNKSKQDADLKVAQKLYRLNKIIKEAEDKKETPSLKHVLLSNGGSKYSFSILFSRLFFSNFKVTLRHHFIPDAIISNVCNSFSDVDGDIK